MYITLFQNDEGLVQGSYRNCDGTNKVLLSGLVNSKGMSLSGSVKGKVCELFELQNVSDSTDRLQGTFSVKGSKARSNVSFRLESICGGNLEHRYSDFFGVDEDVEQFMLEIQQAVKNSDKLWLATHVQYPIEVKMGGNKKQTLKNQNQLIQQYEKIFTPAYKKKLLASCTCNLFVNNNGIMLGSGEIWINQKENSTEELYDFVITTLNN